MSAIAYCECGCGEKNTRKEYTYRQGHSPKENQSLFARLISKTEYDNGDCWEWKGKHIPAGYGRISYKGTEGYVHRYSYVEFVGEIPENQHVCHHCDNPPCWNPDHLFVGTHQDNMIDKSKKGRTWREKCLRGHVLDEENIYVWSGVRRCKECARNWKKERVSNDL